MNISELCEVPVERYRELVESGMFWVYFPEATGIYTEDMKLAHEAKLKEEPISMQEKTKGLNAGKHQWTEDGLTCKAVVKDKVIKIKAVSGYCSHVGNLLKLKDTGNELVAKFRSYEFNKDDNVIELDYSEADYLYKALQVWFEMQNKEPEQDSCNW